MNRPLKFINILPVLTALFLLPLQSKSEGVQILGEAQAAQLEAETQTSSQEVAQVLNDETINLPMLLSMGEVLSPIDGEKMDPDELLKEIEGMPVVLSFGATWCTPCKLQLRVSADIVEKNEGRVHFIEVLSPSSGIDEARVEAKHNKRIHYMMLTSDPDALRTLDIKGTPWTFMLNAQSKIVNNHFGYTTETESLFRGKVEALIKRRVPGVWRKKLY